MRNDRRQTGMQRTEQSRDRGSEKPSPAVIEPVAKSGNETATKSMNKLIAIPVLNVMFKDTVTVTGVGVVGNLKPDKDKGLFAEMLAGGILITYDGAVVRGIAKQQVFVPWAQIRQV